jgi:signal transduction histidine kinase
MQSNDNCIDDVARRASRLDRAAFSTPSLSPTSETQQASDYEALLLAIAGHDLRQPLQAIQSAHELLGLGIRTKSELCLLRSGQRAIDRLTAQLDQLLAALSPPEFGGLEANAPAPHALASAGCPRERV